jgi:hypothetical protein
MLQRLDDAHDREFLGIGPAIAAGGYHLGAGDTLEHGVGDALPYCGYESRAKQVTRRLASDQSNAKGHGLSE